MAASPRQAIPSADSKLRALANDVEDAAAGIITVEPFEGVVLSATRERSDSMLCEDATYAGRSGKRNQLSHQ